uniref:Uncharacterized protein n=1 Tax=Arundo donax TaxID=35708 RepID=A0A0A9A9H6_ARUDO
MQSRIPTRGASAGSWHQRLQSRTGEGKIGHLDSPTTILLGAEC